MKKRTLELKGDWGWAQIPRWLHSAWRPWLTCCGRMFLANTQDNATQISSELTLRLLSHVPQRGLLGNRKDKSVHSGY